MRRSQFPALSPWLNMNKLGAVLSKWTDEDMDTMLRIRAEHAISGHGGICVPAAGAPSYFPFDSYWYPIDIGCVHEKPWTSITSSNPAAVVPVDPFEPSAARSGLRVWDAAIGIPASSSRPADVLDPRGLPCIRNLNSTWTDDMVPALAKVGYVFGTGKFERPKHPFIVDLVAHPLGWRILEAAHALAHLACDMRGGKKSKAIKTGSMNTYMHKALAQLAFCMVYGIPISPLTTDDASSFNYSDMTRCGLYGIKLAVSGRPRAPMARIPIMTPDMLIPDKDIAVVLVGVHTEPHPNGFTSMSNKWKEVNRWSCQPSMVVIAGWELADVICHQPIIANDRRDSVLLEYGMNAVDMFGPDTFAAYLKKAVEHRGLPEGDGYKYVDEWLVSLECEQLIMSTPPLPCKDCMRLNMQADGSPERPVGRRPVPGKPASHDVVASWKKWDSDFEQIFELVKKATIFQDGRLYGHADAIRRRRLQSAGNRERLQARRMLDKLDAEIEKAKDNGYIATVRQLVHDRDTAFNTFFEHLKKGSHSV